MADVLLAGVYMADRETTAGLVTSEFLASRRHRVTVRWLALRPGGAGTTDLPGTVAVADGPAPRCALLNRLLQGLPAFDWVVLCDDDVEMEAGFLDAFLEIAGRCDLAVCQPARTADSHIDHGFVQQMPGLAARRTRFVEIGPVVFLRRDAAALLLPFAESDGMGWGLDFVWPVIAAEAGLRMGIVDSVPVAHRLRPPVSAYSYEAARAEMADTLSRRRHLSAEDAFAIVEAWPACRS